MEIDALKLGALPAASAVLRYFLKDNGDFSAAHPIPHVLSCFVRWSMADNVEKSKESGVDETHPIDSVSESKSLSAEGKWAMHSLPCLIFFLVIFLPSAYQGLFFLFLFFFFDS